MLAILRASLLHGRESAGNAALSVIETKPTSKAYSTRSCARQSFKRRRTRSRSLVMSVRVAPSERDTILSCPQPAFGCYGEPVPFRGKGLPVESKIKSWIPLARPVFGAINRAGSFGLETCSSDQIANRSPPRSANRRRDMLPACLSIFYIDIQRRRPPWGRSPGLLLPRPGFNRNCRVGARCSEPRFHESDPTVPDVARRTVRS